MIRHKFALPENKIYMCGHSLGPLPKATLKNVTETLQSCEFFGAQNWIQNDWIDLPEKLGNKIASIINAKAGEVVVTDSTTVNLFKVIKTAMEIQKNRKIILTTDDNFPANLYLLQGIAARGQIRLKMVKPDEIIDAIDETIAMLVLTHVNYRDAAVFNMESINTKAHRYGVLTIWDLSHSTGILPMDFSTNHVDFAVGCTYKYLSGGPGSPAFVYANKRHHAVMQSPIQGWMGHCQPLQFSEKYIAEGVKKFMGGTPAILSMKALESSLDLFSPVLIKKTHEKLLQYRSFFIDALKNLGVVVCEPNMGGGHVAFIHCDARRIFEALSMAGFLGDFRPPHFIRLCINPLYISLSEINSCVKQIEKNSQMGYGE